MEWQTVAALVGAGCSLVAVLISMLSWRHVRSSGLPVIEATGARREGSKFFVTLRIFNPTPATLQIRELSVHRPKGAILDETTGYDTRSGGVLSTPAKVIGHIGNVRPREEEWWNYSFEWPSRVSQSRVVLSLRIARTD